MLKRIDNESISDALSFLGDDAVSLRIKVNLSIYRVSYSFAEFWAQYDEKKLVTAVISKINGACTLTFSDFADKDELNALLSFIGFSSLFLDKEKADLLGVNYVSHGDILVFDGEKTDVCITESSCDMKQAFALISENEGESIAKLDYLEWLSDFTFKSNRNSASLRALTENGELVSIAMTSVQNEKAALISGVFTKSNYRNKGYGGKVLSALTQSLLDENKKVYIMTAEDKLTAYYKKRGFKVIGYWSEVK